MFSGFSENQCNTVIIYVPNAEIARDIIYQCYGRKLNLSSWKDKIDFLQCQNFFGTEIDPSIYANLTINNEQYPVLLDTINTIGYTKSNIKCLIRNLPDDFDLKIFSQDFIEKTYAMFNNYQLIMQWENKFFVVKWICRIVILLVKVKP